ncbi:phosphonate ABC transporter ATP-binding protein [Microlunatus sp. GCM10028923]|uniref:phosphonate ABC transporter ATP-binding protein n=1 Tax=Microlunatus sp. GCM10028923 TaxID=3273400 RepID=UPI0036095CB8
MTGHSAVIEFDGVGKRFGDTVALDDVTFGVEPGTVVVLLGLSGSGKSTLLRQVNGLQQPTTGTVRVLGAEVSGTRGRSLRELRRQIGFVFQNFHLVGPCTVLENVCTGLLGSLIGPRLGLAMYPRSVRRQALEQLDRVGLADRAFQRADTLSGGQQQRVAIARALVQRPKILLADEPVASLDPESSAQVMELIREIGAEDDLTVLCSLHQVELALDFADRIVGLRSGAVVLDRAAAGLSRDQAMEIYGSVGAEPEGAPAPTRPVRVGLPALAG